MEFKLTLLLQLVVHVVGSQKKIQIDINKGVDNADCLLGKTPCKTLDYVFNTSSSRINLNNTSILLDKGSHALSIGKSFEYLQDFSLISSKWATIYCVNYNTGISFISSQNITVSGVGIQNCGAKHVATSTLFKPLNQKLLIRIAVYFKDCQNVKILHSRFQENLGIAVGMVDVSGTVHVLKSSFHSNSDIHILNEEASGGKYISGGGMHIEISRKQQKLNFKVADCNFHNNSAENNYEFIYPETMIGDEVTYFGKGGGMNINILGATSRNNISILNSNFSNNYALWGGAIFATFKNMSDNNVLTIQNSTFTENTATIGGGGVRIENYQVDNHGKLNSTHGNTVHLDRLKFIENTAIWGGGLSVSSTTRIMYSMNQSSRNINISNCDFQRNSATVGFAIGLATMNLNKQSIGSAMTYRVILTDCNFLANFMVLTEDKVVIGQGAIYAEEVSVVLVGNNYFSKNNYTAVCLDSSTLTFQRLSNSDFDNNDGEEGGAISLYGSSWMTLGKHCKVTFRNNRANRKGGAIYVKNSGPPRIAFQTTKLLISYCFLRYEIDDIDPNKWPVEINFQNNSAPKASGNSIYASSVKFCRKLGEPRNESSALEWKVIRYEGNGQPEVVTNAVNISMSKAEWNAVPNLPFDVELKMYDEKQHNVYGSLQLDIEGANLEPPNKIFLVQDEIRRLRLLGKVFSNYTLKFSTSSGMAVQAEPVHATFKACLPGFEPGDNNTTCVCMNEESSNLVRCYENGTVYILKGKWGYINNSTNLLETVDCPEHFCSCQSEYEDYLCKFDEHEQQCAHNRTGVLCSECPHGLSVTFGDESCKMCTNLYLLLILPVILVLSIFSGIIFRLNIDVFSGYLNAYLYCYQMMPLLMPGNIEFDPFISFIIGVTSLGGTGGNFGTCLYDGMNNLDKMFLNYAIPSYVVFCTIVFGLWVPQKIWEKLFCCCNSENGNDSQVRNHSFGRALSFALVLCYSSFTSVTLKLLHPIKYNDYYVVYEAGFNRFFHGNHLYYFIVAALMLIFVVILFPILLSFTHYFSYRFYTVQRAEPIFNALKNNFEDTMVCRYFAAFYFICRLILLVIAIFVRDEITRLIILAIASVIIQAIFSAIQPYKEKQFNYWDILQLSVMCLISLLSLILSVPFTTSRATRSRLGILLQVISAVKTFCLILPFLFLFGLGLYLYFLGSINVSYISCLNLFYDDCFCV